MCPVTKCLEWVTDGQGRDGGPRMTVTNSYHSNIWVGDVDKVNTMISITVLAWHQCVYYIITLYNMYIYQVNYNYIICITNCTVKCYTVIFKYI